MYNTVTNTLVIHQQPDRVYHYCSAPGTWPQMFAACLSARQRPVHGCSNDFVMEMTVNNNLGRNTLKSKRSYFAEDRRIEFVMLTMPPHFAEMHGTWRVAPHPDGASLEVIHTFRTAEDVTLNRDTLASMVFQNTSVVLGELKAFAERRAAS